VAVQLYMQYRLYWSNGLAGSTYAPQPNSFRQCKHTTAQMCVVMWGGRSFGLHTSKVT
jgi:hypothetical protein